MAEHMPRRPEPEFMDIPAEAAAYAEADFAVVNQAFVDRLLALAGPAERARAVDLGTGPGDISIRVAAACPAWRVAAVDASEAMLAIARRAGDAAGVGGRIDWVLADAKAAPLPDAAFDVVFSNSILHHINDPAALWREVRRLAAPGGLVFLRDLARPPTDRVARALVEKYSGGESALLKDEFHRSLLAAWTPDEVRAQLEAAGLSGLDVTTPTDRHLDIAGRL